jgi:hypothetical protein
VSAQGIKPDGPERTPLLPSAPADPHQTEHTGPGQAKAPANMPGRGFEKTTLRS